MTELIYSKKWHKKDADRKDFTYSPLSKNLMVGMHFPISNKAEKALAVKIIESRIYSNEHPNNLPEDDGE